MSPRQQPPEGRKITVLAQPMSDNRFHAVQPTDGEPGAGYGLRNKAVPSPRQWQMPPPQVPVPRSQPGTPYFHPGSVCARSGLPAASPRRMERAILLCLWLLVMVAAITIGLRWLDLSALRAPVEPVTRPLASAEADDKMRSAALAAARARAIDLFDEPSSTPLANPVSDAPPASQQPRRPTPTEALSEAPSGPTARLTPANALSVERPSADPRAATAWEPGSSPGCADALRAMKLCPAMR